MKQSKSLKVQSNPKTAVPTYVLCLGFSYGKEPIVAFFQVIQKPSKG